MSVVPTVTPQYTTIRPVPKPSPRPIVSGRAAYRLAEAQGFTFEDIAADAEAAHALDVGKVIDLRRDPLVYEMVRLFRAIRHDLNISPASRVMATKGEACGLEAIRLDRIKDEHDLMAELRIDASIEHGRAVVAVQEELLTGREASA